MLNVKNINLETHTKMTFIREYKGQGKKRNVKLIIISSLFLQLCKKFNNVVDLESWRKGEID